LALESTSAIAADPELAVLLGLESLQESVDAGSVSTVAIEALNNAVHASRLEAAIPGGYFNLELSPDGRLLATDSPGPESFPTNELVLWDTGNLSRIGSWSAPGTVVGLLWMTPERLALATIDDGSSKKMTVSVVSPQTSQVEFEFRLERSSLPVDLRPFRLATDETGTKLAAILPQAGDDQLVVVWDLIARAEIFTELVNSATDIALLDQETLLVSRANHHDVLFYELATGNVGRRIAVGERVPARIFLDHDSRSLLVAEEFLTVSNWDLDKGEERWQFDNAQRAPGLFPPGLDVLATPGGSGLVALAAGDGAVHLVDLASGGLVAELVGHEGRVLDMALSADGNRLYTVATSGEVHTWNVSPGGPSGISLARDGGVAIQIDVAPDGSRVGVQSDNGEVAFFELDGDPIAAIEDQVLWWGHSAVLSPDWRYLATEGNDGDIQVRDLATLEPLKMLPPCTSPKAFSPDGRLLAMSAPGTEGVETGCRARVVEWESGREIIDLGSRYFLAAAFNPEGAVPAGRYLLALEIFSDNAGMIEIYDIATGEAVVTIGPGPLFSFAVDPSGRYLAVGRRDGRAQVFDLTALVDGTSIAGATLFDYAVDDDELWGVAISETGLLATSSAESLGIWNIETLELIGSPSADVTLPGFPTFGPDGSYLLYADGRGIHRYVFDTQDLLERAATRVTRSLTGAECERYLIADCPATGAG
jgi:WD40 repeat protein